MRLHRLTRPGLMRLLIVLLISALVTPQAWAWYHLWTAQQALAQYHPEEAREPLIKCQRVWRNRPSIHLLAARAAWQDGDLLTALDQLRIAQRLSNGANDETAFEWALIQAAGGNFPEVEEYLQKRADQSAELAPLVWEALIEGYLRVYRNPDAMACVTLWLRKQPENIRALELRGKIFVNGKGLVRGADDYRKVLSLDPTRKRTRWNLITCLLNLGSYDEAIEHLELFARELPDNPDVQARLARCYLMTQRTMQAQQLLDAALEKSPDHGFCLRIRGQLALAQKDPEQAEQYLRRAAGLLPEDYQTQWLLFEALRQQGKLEEAKLQQAKADELKDRIERIGELQSRKLAEQPLDPALHYEMGLLMWQSGQLDAGEQWMLRALTLNPDHQLTHAALAEHYERQGNKALAEQHRKRANQ